MAAFPSYPKLLLRGAGRTPRPGVVRTEMEAGPPKQALRESRFLEQVEVVYLLTSAADYASFRTFVDTTVSRVDFFDWTDPLDSSTKSARIVGGEVRYTPLRTDLGLWEAAFTLEWWA